MRVTLLIAFRATLFAFLPSAQTAALEPYMDATLDTVGTLWGDSESHGYTRSHHHPLDYGISGPHREQEILSLCDHNCTLASMCTKNTSLAPSLEECSNNVADESFETDEEPIEDAGALQKTTAVSTVSVVLLTLAVW